MNPSTQEILNTFDRLSEFEQWELASQILRRALQLNIPPLSDEELVQNAEELFIELDRRELEDAEP